MASALSSLNAGLYSTGRILHSMSVAGSAPRFAQRVSTNGVPYGGILLTACVAFLGVVLNYFVPKEAFEIVLNIASLGIISSWATIVLSHMKFVSLSKQGVYTRPAYRMPGAPFTDWIVLVFLAGVLVLIGFDYPVGTFTLGSLIIVIPLLVIGWFVVRKNVLAIAAERQGYTGISPIIADRPATAAYKDNKGGSVRQNHTEK